MNVAKAAGLAVFLFAGLSLLVAIPVYGALDTGAITPREYLPANIPGTPTVVPKNLLDDDDFEANDDEVTTQENTPVTIDVLSNDEGVEGEISSLSIDSEPDHGSATVQSDLKIYYVPEAGFTGEDEFEYEVCIEEDDDDDDDDDGGDAFGEIADDDDDDEDCDKADVLVIVDPAPVTNEEPAAVNNTYSVEQEQTLIVLAPGVLANDSDPNGDALTAVLVGGVKNGSLELNPNGSFTYTPADGFTGVETFTYQASDGDAVSNLGSVEIEVIDTEPPTMQWLSPVSDGEVLDVGFEMVHLEVAASDNGTVDKVQFFRWDAQNEVFVDIAEVTDPPYEVEFNSSALNFEWNQILARVYDSAGNVSEHIFIWIYLNENVMKVYLPSVLR
jgi:hypothetical protein